MVKYFVHTHKGIAHAPARYAPLNEVKALLNDVCMEADAELKRSKKQHVVFATKLYDEGGNICQIDIYRPVLLLDNADFYKFADKKRKNRCLILALHAD